MRTLNIIRFSAFFAETHFHRITSIMIHSFPSSALVLPFQYADFSTQLAWGIDSLNRAQLTRP